MVEANPIKADLMIEADQIRAELIIEAKSFKAETMIEAEPIKFKLMVVAEPIKSKLMVEAKPIKADWFSLNHQFGFDSFKTFVINHSTKSGSSAPFRAMLIMTARLICARIFIDKITERLKNDVKLFCSIN